MDSAMLEMACNLTKKQIRQGQVARHQVIARLHQNLEILMQINNRVVENNGTEPAIPRVVDWRRSIRKHFVICLECGLHAKILGAKHLAIHGLSARTYRKKYGMPCTQGLICKELAASRREMVQRWRPWEKSPAAVAAQKRAVAQQAMGRKGRSK